MPAANLQGDALLSPDCPLDRAYLDGVRAVRAALFESHYQPCAVHGPWSLARMADGKLVDQGKQWKKGSDEPGHPALTREYLLKPKLITCNTGVVLGAVRALDIDIPDPAWAEAAVHVALVAVGMEEPYRQGRIPDRIRANSGKRTLFFRASDPTRPKGRTATSAVGKVELLGFGGHTVVHGINKDKKTRELAEIGWQNKPLWEVKLEDLVELSPEAEAAVTEALAGALPEGNISGSASRTTADRNAAPAGVDGSWCSWLDEPPLGDFDAMKAALALPNEKCDWVEWNRAGLQFYAATGGSEGGLAAWEAWTAKLPPERINPDGTPDTCAGRWNHFRSSPPGRTGAGAIVNRVREATSNAEWFFDEPSQPGTSKAEAFNGQGNAPPPGDGSPPNGNGASPGDSGAAGEDDEPSLFDPYADLQSTSFPTHALPAALQPYVALKSRSLGVKETGFAICVLGAVAGATDASVRLVVNELAEFFVRSNLWVMIIGASGAAKSPILKAVVAPLETVDADEVKRYDIDRANYEASKAALLGGVAKAAVPPIKPRQPPRRVVKDTTIEALTQILKRSPRGTLIFDDELAGFFSSFTRYGKGGGGGSDKQAYLKGFDGGSHVVDRVSSGNTNVENWCFSVLGGIQPDLLREKLTDRDKEDGLLQRFLVSPIEARLSPGNPKVDVRQVTADYNKLVKAITYSKYMDFRLDPAAEKVRDEVDLKFFEMARVCNSPAHASAYNKMTTLWAKIALVLAICDQAQKSLAEQRPAPTFTVSLDAAERARVIIDEFVVPNILEVYQYVGSGPARGKPTTARDTMRRIADWLLTSPKGKFGRNGNWPRIVRSDVTAGPLRRATYEEADLTNLLGIFTDGGWLEAEDIKRGQRTVKAWFVNPKIHRVFAEQAAKAAAALKVTKEAIANVGKRKRPGTRAGATI